MKKPGLFASVAAASATAISASCPTSSNSVSDSQQEAGFKRNQENQRSPSTDKFAPKFDGLRFIETLVTAHR
ncbi:hypothetical protein CJ030_MR6G023537 [Morella rubra]|uniref:Uncharacterized protein n=1 Tax=Morella rubra TaxID=262757 RepID=A0A6A1VAS4_9ROSI|nr:hypothetical protein CJ030_MR6G028577 [Morella rubra]KAB1209988.1 hypothetical protein CJ030_MR6G023537 [Morella rubra]